MFTCFIIWSQLMLYKKKQHLQLVSSTCIIMEVLYNNLSVTSIYYTSQKLIYLVTHSPFTQLSDNINLFFPEYNWTF